MSEVDMWSSTPGKWMFCLCLLVAPVVADVSPEEKHPLSPADLSSPRATLQSFMQRADGIAAMLGGEYWHDSSRSWPSRFGSGRQCCCGCSTSVRFPRIPRRFRHRRAGPSVRGARAHRVAAGGGDSRR
ncbi:hypothetical protein [Microbulbifer halophilus]|uniref:hypothetical protein n=1 Tax=Microbulbifer halophilus TaxID=453963 RepID=UPI00361BEAD1